MIRPSWQDYGTYDESAYPEYWDGVVGAWCPSLGPTGSRLHDHSRGSRWGTVTNATLATAWQVNGGQYSLRLDGTDDAVDCGDNFNGVLVGTSARFSISAWVNVAANQNAYVVSKIETSPVANRQFFFRAYDDGLDFAWYGALDATSFRVARHTRTFSTSGWVHIGVDFDARVSDADTKARLYVNGLPVSSSIAFTAGSPVSIQTGTARFAIGGSVTSSGTVSAPLNGSVDDVILYDRLRTQQEWLEHYSLGRGGMYQRRRRSRRRAIEQAGFRVYWVRQRSQIIGGGV